MAQRSPAFAPPLQQAAVARAALLANVEACQPDIQAGAAKLDDTGEFPRVAFEMLSSAGVLLAPLPSNLGGYGFGEGDAGARDLARLLYLLGEANLSVARLFEAHVNALQLILRYGTAPQGRAAAQDAGAGHLFALWVTDPFEGGAVLDVDEVLHGGKAFCSGAGVATRAVITADTAAGAQMLIVGLQPGSRVAPSQVRLGGMRAAITGSIDFTGLHAGDDARLGKPGDYLREPLFSAGAWRGSAAALGGLKALIAVFREEIARRGRLESPHQRERFAQMVIAHETARLWVEQAALRACLEDQPAAAIIAYVNMTRLAVEAACLDAMRAIQRGLGLSAFMAGHPAERLGRDLATYLRQPAPDEVMDLAAAYYLQAGLPGE